MNSAPKKTIPVPLIPENGSVVIIDDNSVEALPILKALSRKGIATTYYTGERAGLPETPTQNVRLMFLDLQLIENNDPKTISRLIVSVLQRIIPSGNGPYLLIIWSKKYHIYGSEVVAEIHNHSGIIPACILNFDKNDCIDSIDRHLVNDQKIIGRVDELLGAGLLEEDKDKVAAAIKTALGEEKVMEYQAKDNAVEIIENFLKTELERAGCFHLFVIWENIVKRAASQMVNDISSIAEMNSHWETNVKNILKRMGIARVGKNYVNMPMLIEESLNTLNTSLLDAIEHKIKDVEIPQYIDLNDPVVFACQSEGAVFELITEEKNYELRKDGKAIGKTEKYDALVKAIAKDGKMSKEDKETGNKIFQDYRSIPFRLNTKLHIELNPSQELIPGNIYFNLEKEKRKQYLKTFFKERKGADEDYILIDLEVSPICDYAQQKWKRSRTLPGVLYPVIGGEEPLTGKHSYLVEPAFIINGKEYSLLFDFHLFNAHDKIIAKARKVEYRLKRELLMDIIANLSAHVNRPGISFIS
jgi:hypothetical protein